MSDDDTNSKINSFDREPAPGSAPESDVSEHADTNHRIEPLSEHVTPTAPKPTRSWAPSPVATHQNQPGAQGQQSAVQSVAGTEATLPYPGPGLMVLQWLTYAFWGWTVFILSFLITLTVMQLLAKNSDGESYIDAGFGIAYLLAAVIVLFVISLITDAFYARAERQHARTTGSNVIMIVHAVIFALFGIGALISAVFGGVRLMLGESSSSNNSVAVASIIAGLIVFALYGATLLRTLRPRWMKNVAAGYWVVMTVVIIISVILGVMGPAAQARLRNRDKAVEISLPDVAQAINDQTTSTGTLPTSLDKLTSVNKYSYQSDTQALIDSGKVDYKPGEKLVLTPRILQLQKPGSTLDQLGGTDPVLYHYQLCVVYKTSKGDSRYDSTTSYRQNSQQYPTTLSTYSHPAGKKCYDLQTSNTTNY